MNTMQNSDAALAAATPEEERGMAMKVRQFVDTIKMASLAALTVFSADAAQGEDAYIESDGNVLDGENDSKCEVLWERRNSSAGPVVYGVRPVSPVGGKEVLGTESTAEVAMTPPAMCLMLR